MKVNAIITIEYAWICLSKVIKVSKTSFLTQVFTMIKKIFFKKKIEMEIKIITTTVIKNELK